jgi:thiamine pyrophosphokinase
VLILAHGDRPSRSLLERLRAGADLFIATDGAANCLAEIGLTPDVILGDFDSLTPGIRERMPGVEFFDAPDQNASDLDKGIQYACDRGAEQITLTGAAGGRIDHTLTAFSLLMKYQGRADVRVVMDTAEVRAVSGAAQIIGNPGDTISLVIFEGAPKVTLTGVQWPLKDELLHPGSRGVSNVLTEHQAHIQVADGTVFVVSSPDGELTDHKTDSRSMP